MLRFISGTMSPSQKYLAFPQCPLLLPLFSEFTKFMVMQTPSYEINCAAVYKEVPVCI